jgi:hypothetical protein
VYIYDRYGASSAASPPEEKFDLIIWAWRGFATTFISIPSYVVAPIVNQITKGITGDRRAAPLSPVTIDKRGEFVTQKLYSGEFAMPKEQGLELFKQSTENVIGLAAGGLTIEWGTGNWAMDQALGLGVGAGTPLVTDPLMNALFNANGVKPK